MDARIEIVIDQKELSDFCEFYFVDNNVLPSYETIRSNFIEKFFSLNAPSLKVENKKIRVCYISRNGVKIEFR